MVMISNQWYILVSASLVAAVFDVRTGRIPNGLTVPLAVLGMGSSLWFGGPRGLGESILVMILLALPFFIMFALGHGGGGDVKMMGAIGTWVGIYHGLIVLAMVCISGGILALLRMITLKERRSLFINLFGTLYLLLVALLSGKKGWKLLRADPKDQNKALTAGATIPYGVAIFIGVCLSTGLVYYEIV